MSVVVGWLQVALWIAIVKLCACGAVDQTLGDLEHDTVGH